MGNGYNHHRHHHHHQNLQHLNQKGTFLPMLCSRSYIKDVVALPKLEGRSMSLSTDPLSPKIGCMGQVKRHNNKIVGFPTSSSSSSSAASFNKITAITPSVKYSKLKRIFSVKNSSFTTCTTSIPNTSNCERRKGVILNNGARNRGPKIDDSKDNASSISTVRIEDMDPPLPVIKKVHKPASVNGNGGEEDTLWKRRSGGVALKTLQLQQIQLNRHNLAPTTV